MDIDLALLREVETAKEIPFNELIEIVEAAVLAAYQRNSGNREDGARAEVNRQTGNVHIYTPELDEEGKRTGETDVTPEDFGRIAANSAKQVIAKRLRDISDEGLLGEFKGKEGDIVTGQIQQGFRPDVVYLNLGPIEAEMPASEQVPGEDYSHGRRIRVFIAKVERTMRGPKIVVSRTHPGLVLKLFALEVPEIESGVVEIVRIAREAGHRTKIAVRAVDPSINAKGSCIGELGQRVRAVQAELNEEKIDIVDYSDNLTEFVAHALSPAKVSSCFVIDANSPEKKVRALVPDFQLSLAIGKEGQNVRLAHKLTGAKIDVQPDSVMEED